MSLKSAVQSRQARDSQQKRDAIEDVQTESTRRLNVNVPASNYKAFKLKAVQNDVDMSELINQWINEYISKNK
jgi:hypothetical protein